MPHKLKSPQFQPFIESSSGDLLQTDVNNHINSLVVLDDWLGSESRLPLAVITFFAMPDITIPMQKLLG